MNELHVAARIGSIERTIAVISRGAVDIDQGTTPHGGTALMIAAACGHSSVVRILLNKGANVLIVNDNGFAALHFSAQEGPPAVTKLLVKAGADLEAKTSSEGITPLHLAAEKGHSEVMGVLIEAGADLEANISTGSSVLHLAAQEGHLAVAKQLVKACADLEAKTSKGSKALRLAAECGHSEVMGVLIEAGANPNSRNSDDGATPLYSAAQRGHLAAAKVLLRAKANPLLTCSSPSGVTFIPLDTAAHIGHLEVVGELTQELGIGGCGGASGGVNALKWAAKNQHVEIMAILTSAGVVDTGIALTIAATFGRESSVKFLLQQQEWKASGQGVGYLETINRFGATPLVCSTEACRSCSPRIARLLVDAGADTTTAVRLILPGGLVCFNGTPLALVDYYVRVKTMGGKDATESQLHSLEGTRRLLLRVEAVHAVSWLWARDAPSIAHAAAEGTGRATKTTPTPLISSTLPIFRRRAERPRVLLAALFRHSRKPC